MKTFDKTVKAIIFLMVLAPWRLAGAQGVRPEEPVTKLADVQAQEVGLRGEDSQNRFVQNNSETSMSGYVLPTSDREGKYKWQAELVSFSDNYDGFPAVAISRVHKNHSWMFMYSNSDLPDIRKKAVFLRSEGVPIKSVTYSVLVNDNTSGVNVISTATYTVDLVDEFKTRVQSFELFYCRQIFQNDFVRANFLVGIPVAWHQYLIDGTLENDVRYREAGSAFGWGISPGLAASFGSVSTVSKGFVGSFLLMYNNFWFTGPKGKAAKGMQDRLNNFRFGFSLGWRFAFS